jgi:hypothetical protein
MYVDREEQFSDAQALTGTAASTDLIDLGPRQGDQSVAFGVGTQMVVVIQLTVAADDANADETYVADLETDSTAAFSSATTLGTVTITRGDAAGTRYYIHVPLATTTERFIRLNYTLGGTTPSVTLDAWLAPAHSVQNDEYYENNSTITN